MSHSSAVTDATFAEDVLASNETVLVDFWAAWCGPCRAVSPILDAIASEHPEKLKLVKLDVDANPITSAAYGITSIPAMKVFRNGEIVTSFVGAAPKTVIEAQLADVFA